MSALAITAPMSCSRSSMASPRVSVPRIALSKALPMPVGTALSPSRALSQAAVACCAAVGSTFVVLSSAFKASSNFFVARGRFSNCTFSCSSAALYLVLFIVPLSYCFWSRESDFSSSDTPADCHAENVALSLSVQLKIFFAFKPSSSIFLPRMSK